MAVKNVFGSKRLSSKQKVLFVGVYKHIQTRTRADLFQNEFKICFKVSYFLRL